VTALLVALGPILVMVGIGVGIAGIGNDDFTMVNLGMGIAAIGLVVTIAGFVVLRRSASRPKLDPFDDGRP
jgi:hypothetical protein